MSADTLSVDVFLTYCEIGESIIELKKSFPSERISWVGKYYNVDLTGTKPHAYVSCYNYKEWILKNLENGTQLPRSVHSLYKYILQLKKVLVLCNLFQSNFLTYVRI